MLTRDRVSQWLQRRFLLRLHMSFILGGTFLAGLATTHVLLLTGFVPNLALRYGVAVCVAYLAFLTLIRLWLTYVGIREDNALDLAGDGVDLAGEIEWGSSGSMSTGGGSFGGGGASGSWSTPRPMGVVNAQTAPPPPPAPAKASGFKLPSFDFDFDEWIVVVLFLALVASLLFAGIYIIYTAPAILSEAAFEALLAGALLRRAKKIDGPGWVGAVTRATAWPFIAILLLSIGLGWAVQKSCPGAVRMRDAFHCVER